MSSATHQPLARWIWASGLMTGQSLWSFAVHNWVAGVFFGCVAISLAVIYRLEGSYGSK